MRPDSPFRHSEAGQATEPLPSVTLLRPGIMGVAGSQLGFVMTERENRAGGRRLVWGGTDGVTGRALLEIHVAAA